MAIKSGKKVPYPEKRTMNLYYKPDRTTFPSTVALYVLFVLALLLAFWKFFVYDTLTDIQDKRDELARLESLKTDYEEQLKDYGEVLKQYQMYAATEDEDSQTDRMKVLALLDKIVAPNAGIESVSISGGTVTVQLSGATLRETAGLVRQLTKSKLVESATVNTASTIESADKDIQASLQITLAREARAEEVQSGAKEGDDETTTDEP